MPESPPEQPQGPGNAADQARNVDEMQAIRAIFAAREAELGRSLSSEEMLDLFSQMTQASESGASGSRRGGRGASEETDAFKMSEDAFRAEKHKEIKRRIDAFSERVSSQGFDAQQYDALAKEVNDLYGGRDALEEAVEGDNEGRRLLGMYLAEIVRKAPNIGRENYTVEAQRYEERIDEIVAISEDNREDQDKKYELLDQLVEALPMNDGGGQYGIILDLVIAKLKEKGDRRAIEYVLEYAMERFFSPADNQIYGEFPQLNFYAQQNVDAVMDAARHYSEGLDKLNPNADPKKSFYVYMQEARSKRMIAHELFRGMKDPERYKGGVADYLRKEGLDFIEKKIAGTAAVQRNYERILGHQLAMKKGWLTEQEFKDADKQMERVLEGLSRNNRLNRTITLDDGRVGERGLRAWERSRALSMGRAMVALSQRRAAYTALGDIPSGSADALYSSVDQELIVRTLAPLKFITQRFYDQPIAKKFMEMYLEEMRKRAARDKQSYGVSIQRNGEAKRYGLYGKQIDSMTILDTTLTDFKSNGWRARLMFLKQDEFATERIPGKSGDNTYSVGEYIDEMMMQADAELKDRINSRRDLPQDEKERMLHNHHFIDPEKKKIFNDSIREVLRKQRLFLGTLMRERDLDLENRQTIWEQAVRLNPSKIAALLPTLTRDIVKSRLGCSDEQADKRWSEITEKLWVAEDARVSEDSTIIQNNVKLKKADMFEGVKENLQSYFAEAGITPEEAGIINELIQVGVENSAALARTKHVFNSILEDAPVTGYEKLGSLDVGRMIEDQASTNQGLGKFTEIAENCAKKPEEIFKELHEYFVAVKGPAGLGDAQKYAEPVIITYIRMVKMYPFAKHLPMSLIGDPLRTPESLAETFNLQSDIALTDQEVFDFIRSCAQQEMVSDDLTEVNELGQTQFMRLRDETDTSNKKLWAASLRLFIYIFGIAYAMEAMKAMFPRVSS